MTELDFANEEVQKILSLWKGKVKFKREGNKIIQLELSKTYSLAYEGNHEVNFILDRVINGYNFLTVEGDKQSIQVTATVKPQSLVDFKNYCYKLVELDKDSELLGRKI